MKSLVYVMTPMCGWCFGTGHNILEIYKEFSSKIEFEFVIGKMWLGDDAPYGSKDFRNTIEGFSSELKSVTGFEPSEKYFELTEDSEYKFDCKCPASAISAVKELSPDRALEFSKYVQEAMFIDGKRLNDPVVYEDILKEMKLDFGRFSEIWLSDENMEAMFNEFKYADKFAELYPTLLYREGEHAEKLAVGHFDLEKIRDLLRKLIQ